MDWLDILAESVQYHVKRLKDADKQRAYEFRATAKVWGVKAWICEWCGRTLPVDAFGPHQETCWHGRA